MIDEILRYYNPYGITNYPYRRREEAIINPPHNSVLFFKLKDGTIVWTKDLDTAKQYHKKFTSIYSTYFHNEKNNYKRSLVGGEFFRLKKEMKEKWAKN